MSPLWGKKKQNEDVLEHIGLKLTEVTPAGLLFGGMKNLQTLARNGVPFPGAQYFGFQQAKSSWTERS